MVIMEKLLRSKQFFCYNTKKITSNKFIAGYNSIFDDLSILNFYLPFTLTVTGKHTLGRQQLGLAVIIVGQH
jgi:hypothetical protein